MWNGKTLAGLAVVLGAAVLWLLAGSFGWWPRDAGGPRIERLSGVWVEGPGFDVSYGGDYQGCAQRCLANPRCVMIEYYRPERKCNLYDSMRPRLTGGSSDVGIRK